MWTRGVRTLSRCREVAASTQYEKTEAPGRGAQGLATP